MFPGPPTIPLLGNALYFLGDSHYLFKQGVFLSQLYRRRFRIWIGPKLFICLVTPQDIELFLNNTVHIKKSKIYNFLMPWIKTGLLTSFGNKWHKTRKVLTPAFHFKILDGFIDIFNKNGQIMCKLLEEEVGKPYFNVVEPVKLCALDNIAETAMGVKLNAQRNPAIEYAEAIKTICHIVYLRTIRPWYAPDFLLNISKYGRWQKHALGVLHNYTRKVINERVEQRKLANSPKISDVDDLGIKSKKAFLDILLDSYDDGSLTLDEVQEEVDTFMFEGHDTVTSALAFALYNLAHSPDVQDRVLLEQEEIFGKGGRLPNMDDLNQMKYLEMVIKETLRLQPSVPVFGRYIEKELKLDDYATIPAGIEALVVAPGVHRNPDVWEKPEKFDPERFSQENSLKRHPYAFIPFSAGPRNCIGMKFAMFEMKATLSKVIRKFKLKPGNPMEALKLAPEVVLVSLSGVKIAIENRETRD